MQEQGFDGELVPVADWSNVPQLGIDTPARGGAGGQANAQAQSLLNRTQKLREDIDTTEQIVRSHSNDPEAHPEMHAFISDAASRAELARDAAIAAAGPLYATEESGRSAVADGATFAVQGGGDIAASIYRRQSAGISTFLVSIPSSDQGSVVMRESALQSRQQAYSDFWRAGFSQQNLLINAIGKYEQRLQALDFFSGISQSACIKLTENNNLYGGIEIDFLRTGSSSEVIRIDMRGKQLPAGASFDIQSVESAVPFWRFGINHKGIVLDDKYTSETLVSQEQLYGWYDALIPSAGGLLSSAVIGYAQSGEEIKEYTLATPAIQYGDDTTNLEKTILIVGGVHGYEKNGMICPYLFLRNLIQNWRADETLATIKHSTTIKIIPVANPWGLNNNTRHNSRNVDLNRNFSADWTLSSSTGDRYSGPSPFSEAESQVLRSAIQRSGISAVIDSHTHVELGYALWLATLQEPSIKIARKVAADLQSWLRINGGASETSTLVRITSNGGGTFARYAQQVEGKQCILSECYAETTNSTLLTKSNRIYRRYGELSITHLVKNLIA